MDCGIDTRMHSFFYTVGVATTATIFYYFWNNHYPVTTDRLITDAGWAYCGLETRFTRMGQQISKVLSPFISLVSPGRLPEKEIKLYNVNNEMVKELSLLDFEELKKDLDFKYSYGVFSIKNEDNHSMTRLFFSNEVPDLKELKFSSATLLSAVLKEEGKDDIDLNVASHKVRSFLVKDNALFTKEFMYNAFDIILAEDYTIEVIDSSVNQHIVKKDGMLRVNEDNLELVNPCDSRDSSFEEIESKKRVPFLFGWIGKENEPTSKKND